MALETACVFTLWEDFCDLGFPRQLASSLAPCVPQVGFRKRTRDFLGSHTPLELVLAAVSLLLAALLLGCLVALGVQYHKGRVGPHLSPALLAVGVGVSGGSRATKVFSGQASLPPAFLSPPNLLVVMALPKAFAFPRLTDSPLPPPPPCSLPQTHPIAPASQRPAFEWLEKSWSLWTVG